VSESRLAKRYLVSGRVQGVGYRYFTQDAAEKLEMTGYVRNCEDGRVEILAMGAPWQHAKLRALLERGPMFSSVSEVREESAAIEPEFESGFVINHNI
jgi:acylphosphatase